MGGSEGATWRPIFAFGELRAVSFEPRAIQTSYDLLVACSSGSQPKSAPAGIEFASDLTLVRTGRPLDGRQDAGATFGEHV